MVSSMVQLMMFFLYERETSLTGRRHGARKTRQQKSWASVSVNLWRQQWPFLVQVDSNGTVLLCYKEPRKEGNGRSQTRAGTQFPCRAQNPPPSCYCPLIRFQLTTEAAERAQAEAGRVQEKILEFSAAIVERSVENVLVSCKICLTMTDGKVSNERPGLCDCPDRLCPPRT